MEIVFLFVSIVMSILVCYGISRSATNSHYDLLWLYKQSDWLFEFHLLLGTLMTLVFWITLCACNNTFWHLPYLFN